MPQKCSASDYTNKKKYCASICANCMRVLKPTGNEVLPEYTDNTAAKAAGKVNGDLYRTGDIVKQVHS